MNTCCTRLLHTVLLHPVWWRALSFQWRRHSGSFQSGNQRGKKKTWSDTIFKKLQDLLLNYLTWWCTWQRWRETALTCACWWVFLGCSVDQAQVYTGEIQMVCRSWFQQVMKIGPWRQKGSKRLRKASWAFTCPVKSWVKKLFKLKTEKSIPLSRDSRGHKYSNILHLLVKRLEFLGYTAQCHPVSADAGCGCSGLPWQKSTVSLGGTTDATKKAPPAPSAYLLPLSLLKVTPYWQHRREKPIISPVNVPPVTLLWSSSI